jgi:hypothetical protein
MAESPQLSPKKSAERTARTERLAKALRENLRRRKEQARAQQQRAPSDEPVNIGRNAEGEPAA